jgi:hypothetical protein
MIDHGERSPGLLAGEKFKKLWVGEALASLFRATEVAPIPPCAELVSVLFQHLKGLSKTARGL